MSLFSTNTIAVLIKTSFIKGNINRENMNRVKVKVSGMNCNHCKIKVENTLIKIAGIQIAVADLMHGEVTLKGEAIDLDKVKYALESIGYSYAGELG